jgi:hypothetical protein
VFGAIRCSTPARVPPDQWVIVASTGDSSDVPGITHLLQRNGIPVTSGGEFGIYFRVPPTMKDRAVDLLKASGYSEHIYD